MGGTYLLYGELSVKKKVTELVGNDYMANAGGSVHGHPGGTSSGAKAMRQAIEKKHEHEYEQAISKWGLIK